MPRRRAIVWAGGALLTVAGAALFGRKAVAITLVEADEQTQALFHSACGPIAYHEKMLAEARAALEGRVSNGPRVVQGAIDCPVCGCRLALDERKPDPPR
jgi:hypothetical protein